MNKEEVIKVKEWNGDRTAYIRVPAELWNLGIEEKKKTGRYLYDLHMIKKSIQKSLPAYEDLYYYLQERVSFRIDICLERIHIL
jgi:hypothetical protein